MLRWCKFTMKCLAYENKIIYNSVVKKNLTTNAYLNKMCR